jgi:hypothetical protein
MWKRPVVWPADHHFFRLTGNLAALSGSIPWSGESRIHMLHLGRTRRIKRLREILQTWTPLPARFPPRFIKRNIKSSTGTHTYARCQDDPCVGAHIFFLFSTSSVSNLF